MNRNNGNDARGMAAPSHDLNLEAGRDKLRHALRGVVERLERDAKSVNLVRFGSFGAARTALAGHGLPERRPDEAQADAYNALAQLMTDVVKHNLLDPADSVYLTAMDALAACEEC